MSLRAMLHATVFALGCLSFASFVGISTVTAVAAFVLLLCVRLIFMLSAPTEHDLQLFH